MKTKSRSSQVHFSLTYGTAACAERQNRRQPLVQRSRIVGMYRGEQNEKLLPPSGRRRPPVSPVMERGVHFWRKLKAGVSRDAYQLPAGQPDAPAPAPRKCPARANPGLRIDEPVFDHGVEQCERVEDVDADRPGGLPDIGALAVVAGSLVRLACGDSSGDSGGNKIVRVDEREGSVRGVRLGDSLEEVKQRLPGGIEADPRTSRSLPLVGDQEELGLPGVIDPPRDGIPIEDFGLLRYQHLSILFARPTGAYVIKIAIPGARTLAGVGLGDPLDAARAAYPNIRCDVQNRNSEYVPYPYCTTKLGDGSHIWFGQDPIRSITLSSTPL